MIRILVEVSSGTARFRAVVQAESVEQAVGVARARYPGSEVGVLFPSDPKTFFAQGLDPSSEQVWPDMPEEAAGSAGVIGQGARYRRRPRGRVL